MCTVPLSQCLSHIFFGVGVRVGVRMIHQGQSFPYDSLYNILHSLPLLLLLLWIESEAVEYMFISDVMGAICVQLPASFPSLG